MELLDHQPVGFLLELLPEIGWAMEIMALTSLIQGQMAKPNRAVFRYDIVGNVFRWMETTAPGVSGHDAGNGAMFGGGGQGHDALAALGMKCAVSIVRCAAGAGELVQPRDSGANLTGEVNFRAELMETMLSLAIMVLGLLT